MKEYEIFTPTFSKLIKAVDKDSAKIAFEQMFKNAEIIQIKEYEFMGEIGRASCRERV
mgnify:CR=1 FL=1